MNRVAVLAVFVACCGTEARGQTAQPPMWTIDSAGGISLLDQDTSRSSGRSGQEQGLWKGTIRIFLGAKALDEVDWEPVESQGEFAILTDFGPEEWPIRMAVDLRLGASQVEDFLGFDILSTSWELNLGVRRVFETGSSVKPYIGGGLSLGGAELELDGVGESGSGVGLWLDVGVDFGLGGSVSLGFELAFSFIPVEIVGIDTDAGGGHFGFTLGFDF